MTASVIFCRPTVMGGEGMPAPEPLNSAVATWFEGADVPQGALGHVFTLAQSPSGIMLASNSATGSSSPNGPPGVLRSTDGGHTWAAVHIAGTPGGQSVDWVTWSGSAFVALSVDLDVASFYSLDGLSWTAGGTMSSVSGYAGVASNGSGTICWCMDNEPVYVCTDGLGLNWTEPATFLSGSGSAGNTGWVRWDGSQFLVYALKGGDYGIATSPDGVTWGFTAFSNQTDLPISLDGRASPGGYLSVNAAGDIRYGQTLAEMCALAPVSTGYTILSCCVTALGRLIYADSEGQMHQSHDYGAHWVTDTVPWGTVLTAGGVTMCALGANAAMGLYQSPNYVIGIRPEQC
jgi:hypothetical protein